MLRYVKVKAILGALAIAGGAGIASVAVLPSSPALGFYSPPLLLRIHVGSPATLIARGAAVNVHLRYDCAGTQTAQVTVNLTERVRGRNIAAGSEFVQVNCANARRTVRVAVAAQSGGKAFQKGVAFAQADIFGCAPRFCADQPTQRTIKIVR
jgi:hypothetical protein